MKILILGGTRFVGRAITEAALSKGHEVTLFNRGRSQSKPFANVETLIGDRDGGLDALKGKQWDAVIDSSGYVPRLVGDSARLLQDSVGQYTFISTISTYADFSELGIDEASAQSTLADPSIEEINGETYGPLKTHCEAILDETMPGRVLHVRPALIVGPHDAQDLFPYWVARVARGGEVLVPGQPDAQMQVIDARDLGRWVVSATEQRLKGAYITTGPDRPFTIEMLLQACLRVTGAAAQFTYVGDDFLLAKGLTPNEQTPWWIPESHAGYGQFNNQKAMAAGLTFRPLSETVADTWAWLQTRPTDYVWRSGLLPDTEETLLAEWLNSN